MNSAALSSLSTSSPLQRISSFIPNSNSNSGFTPSLFNPLKISPKLQLLKQHRLVSLRASNSQTVSHGSDSSLTNPVDSSFVDDPNVQHGDNKLRFEIRKAVVPPFVSSRTERFTLGDRVSFLLAFIACTTSVAFTSLVVAAVPTLFAMRRTAISLAKLADTAREELPSTMAAVRLSSMEISDLTLELSDLSQEITEGISKSAQVVQAAEDGIKQIGTLAHKQTVSMIEERANLPVISWQPVVSGAAKKTSHAVGSATRTIMSIISRRGSNSVISDDEEDGL